MLDSAESVREHAKLCDGLDSSLTVKRPLEVNLDRLVSAGVVGHRAAVGGSVREPLVTDGPAVAVGVIVPMISAVRLHPDLVVRDFDRDDVT